MPSRLKPYAIFFTLLSALSANSEESVPHSYRLTSTGGGDSGQNGVKLNNDALVYYTRTRHGNVVDVRCDSLKNTARVNEKLLWDRYTDRNKYVIQEGTNPPKEMLAKDDPQLKQQLEESFFKPLMTLELDGLGNEIKRTYTTAPGAKPVLETGPTEICAVFHGQFLAKEPRWTRHVELVINGTGSTPLAGELTFEKVLLSRPQTRQTVKVSGTLKCMEMKTVDGKIWSKNNTMTLEGNEVFDTEMNEWIIGDLKQTLTMEFPDNSAGKCVFNIKFELMK
jgi:hypothetical protein